MIALMGHWRRRKNAQPAGGAHGQREQPAVRNRREVRRALPCWTCASRRWTRGRSEGRTAPARCPSSRSAPRRSRWTRTYYVISRSGGRSLRAATRGAATTP
ncbi:hypothetical protein QJS66_10190 [Kocuria rhizophila]|nr:hypothetical protein QJS66_10190 [Kocuria rhizophila]